MEVVIGVIEKSPRRAAEEAIAGAGVEAPDVATVAGAAAGAVTETATKVATGIGMMGDTTSGSGDGSGGRPIMTGAPATVYRSPAVKCGRPSSVDVQ